MELQVASGDALSVSEAVFAREYKEGLVHQAVVAYMAAGRAGTKGQKNRSAVSGGGIKPWRQKGTGRARAGTIRSPIWRSGGVTFAASNRDYSQKMNKKAYRAAMSAILSELIRKERLIVVPELSIAEPKTKLMIAKLAELNVNNALLVTAEDDMNIALSVRNVIGCDALSVARLNPVSLLAHEHVVVTASAIEKIQEWLS
ncbi:MAG TPA: 50S ribosomal protein L4 [Thiothrix sp.]|nr:50S ribosomal protein L4 [Thiothrix sp.]